MANRRHLEILRKGVEAWNKWREENRDIDPDLSYATLNHTNLSYANLSYANLSHAKLNYTNLGYANLVGVKLIETKLIKANLNYANLSHANEFETKPIKVNFSYASLFEANLSYANFTNTNFSYANFANTNFSYANLLEANLSYANLNRASFIETDLRRAKFIQASLTAVNFMGQNLIETNLSGAKLIAAQALYTDFEKATLTGACIKDWNINTKTNLKNIVCDHIYLDFILNEEEDKYIFSDRRPHQKDKYFEPGDFETLVRKAQETVDLIFSDGIDWKAFFQAFQELKEQYRDENLSIQGMDRKTGGAFVIRLEVNSGANKAEIQKSIETKYKRAFKIRVQQYRKELNWKDEQIEIYKQQNTNLWEIVKLKANEPVNMTQNIQGDWIMSGNNYNQSGNFGIGHMSGGEIKESAKIAGVINEVQQKQSLAEAATEIQQLLNQLSQTDSPEEAEQKVAEDLANKAKQDPSFKEKLKNWSLSITGKGAETAVVESIKEGVKRVIPMAITLLV
jgi:uncharacterized protein YjbI with pentapeptide repeats